MKKTKISIILCLVVLLCGLLGNSDSSVEAAETSGGQVSSTSKITFYQDELKPKPVKPEVTRPKPGILPQTGEKVKNFASIGVFFLVVVVSLFFLKKNKESKYEK